MTKNEGIRRWTHITWKLVWIGGNFTKIKSENPFQSYDIAKNMIKT